jgi:hypothetical protein
MENENDNNKIIVDIKAVRSSNKHETLTMMMIMMMMIIIIINCGINKFKLTEPFLTTNRTL